MPDLSDLIRDRDNSKPLKTRRLSVPLSDETLDIIEKIALEEKRSVAKQLEFMIERYITMSNREKNL